MKGGKPTNSARETLQREGILGDLTASISSFVSKASEQGFSNQQMRKILNDLLCQEINENESKSKEALAKSALYKKSLSSINISVLYSKYIDSINKKHSRVKSA